MKKSEVKVGGKYRMSVSGQLVTVRVDAIVEQEGYRRPGYGQKKSPDRTVYECTNLKTGKKCRAKSAAKFRSEVRSPVLVPSKKFVGGDAEAEAMLKLAGAEQRSDPQSVPVAVDQPHQVATTGTQAGSTLPMEGEQRDPFTQPISANGTLESKTLPQATSLVEQPRISPTLPPVPANVNSASRELKGDQKAAFDIVTARISGNERITKLCGYAGTGKTWLLARVAEWAKARRFDVTIAAPTHKAAGVIQEKLGADVEVKTIHSLLGMKLEPDYENDTGGRVLKVGESKLKRGVVIVDEASMIGKELKAQIDVIPGVNWLFVGDLAQLPPVGESISELLDNPDATLATVLRQAQGSEILNLATRIREGDLEMNFDTGKDVFRVADAEELFQEAKAKFASPQYRDDAAHARMLVFKNARRSAINNRMRRLLVNADVPYTAGEWLVMYAAFSPEKSKLNVLAEQAKDKGGGRHWKPFFNYKESLGNNITQLHVSEEVLILDAGQATVKVGPWEFAVWSLTVRARKDQTFVLPVLTNREAIRVEGLKAEHAKAAQEARLQRDEHEYGSHQWEQYENERKSAWGTYFTLEETFASTDYAYSMTVHKSQGSTFDHAFVDVPDLLSSGGMQQRILYTAVTRPAKTLTFYN